MNFFYHMIFEIEIVPFLFPPVPFSVHIFQIRMTGVYLNQLILYCSPNKCLTKNSNIKRTLCITYVARGQQGWVCLFQMTLIIWFNFSLENQPRHSQPTNFNHTKKSRQIAAQKLDTFDCERGNFTSFFLLFIPSKMQRSKVISFF